MNLKKMQKKMWVEVVLEGMSTILEKITTCARAQFWNNWATIDLVGPISQMLSGMLGKNAKRGMQDFIKPSSSNQIRQALILSRVCWEQLLSNSLTLWLSHSLTLPLSYSPSFRSDFTVVAGGSVQDPPKLSHCVELPALPLSLSPTLSISHSSTHPLSLSHSSTISLSHSLTLPLTHSLTLLLTLPLTHSPSLSPTVPLTLPISATLQSPFSGKSPLFGPGCIIPTLFVGGSV